MKIYCSCGKRIRVQDNAVGLKVVCPKCSQIVLIEKPREDPFARMYTKRPPKRTFKSILRMLLLVVCLGLVMGLLGGLVYTMYTLTNPAARPTQESALDN